MNLKKLQLIHLYENLKNKTISIFIDQFFFYFPSLFTTEKSTWSSFTALYAFAFSVSPLNTWHFSAEKCGQNPICSNTSFKYILCRPQECDDTLESPPAVDTRYVHVLLLLSRSPLTSRAAIKIHVLITSFLFHEIRRRTPGTRARVHAKELGRNGIDDAPIANTNAKGYRRINTTFAGIANASGGAAAGNISKRTNVWYHMEFAWHVQCTDDTAIWCTFHWTNFREYHTVFNSDASRLFLGGQQITWTRISSSNSVCFRCTLYIIVDDFRKIMCFFFFYGSIEDSMARCNGLH